LESLRPTLLLLALASCHPAAQANDRGAAAPVAQKDESRKDESRRALRNCVKACNRRHERESAAHVACMRGCLGIAQQERNEAADSGRKGEVSAPLAIAFAMSVSSVFAVLALLF
jgi:hypothetical protein